MKPIIIYQPIDQQDNVIISKDDLEKLISDIYEQGRRDGIWHHPTPATPSPLPDIPLIPTWPTHPVITWSNNTEQQTSV